MKTWFLNPFGCVFDGQARPSDFSGCCTAVRNLILCMAYINWGAPNLARQDVEAQPAKTPIVLRDLTLIRGKSVSKFDDTSIVLSDGSRLTWDQVLKANVAEDRQKEFNLMLNQIGLPLFRLKSRIGNGDWAGAGEIAEPIYDASIVRGNVSPDTDTFYLVCLATMKSRIRKGDRAAALMPFIRAARLQPKVSKQVREIVGARGIPQRDQETGLSHELLPVWFDNSTLQKAASSLSNWLGRVAQDNGPAPAPGTTIYLASLKIELGQTEEAMRLLRSVRFDSDAELSSWRTVLEARHHQKTKNLLNAQTMLEMNEKKITGLARLAALYYRGINVVDQPDTSDLDRSKAILTLLRIPALHGDEHRDLAAAAIYQSAEIAKLRRRATDEQKLRDELLRRYPRTYHGYLETNHGSGQQ
jgi:hypothetical protein